MNFGELKSLARAYVPEAKTGVVTIGTIGTILNLAVADIATKGKLIRTYEDFDSLTGVGKYSLSENLTRFLALDDGGVWFSDGNFRRMDSISVGKMLNDFPSFPSDAADVPLRAYVLGDDLYLHPAVKTGGTDKIRVFFIQRPQVMTLDTHYPFHKESDQTIEQERLEILSESILLYAESRILKVCGEKNEALVKYNEYVADLTAKLLSINARPDISISKLSRFQGPRVP